MANGGSSGTALSVVVVAYEMPRELPRTLQSLAASYQRGIAEADYEVIVVDNGSEPPLSRDIADRSHGNVRWIRIDDAPPSPSVAVNAGLAAARGQTVGVLVDGARLVSPGLLALALRTSRLGDRTVAAALSFHLGPGAQRETMAAGYRPEEEDRLLASIGWPEDGYRLFEISALAPSSAEGLRALPAESNALFMSSELWEELGGYDEAFQSPGGGLANHDTLARACALPGAEVVVLLGEATFHQIHGGVSTNSTESRWREFHDEYVRLRGVPWTLPDVRPLYLGRLPAAALDRLVPPGQPGDVSGFQPYRPEHLPPVRGRGFGMELGPSTILAIQHGTLRSRHRGVAMLKSPFDLALFAKLIDALRPRTIIEIGSKEGGSALWFADALRIRGIEGRIISVDLEAPAVTDPLVEFRVGDARALGDVLSGDELARLPHPFLIAEDSAHFEDTCLAVLRFFHPHLASGDYIVIEDGMVSSLPVDRYLAYEDGPARAISAFLAEHDEYEIDEALCDFYGPNVTWAPNGWLRRR